MLRSYNRESFHKKRNAISWGMENLFTTVSQHTANAYPTGENSMYYASIAQQVRALN